jgi:hypothetical protein
MSTPEARLEALRRKFKRACKPDEHVVLDSPYVDRHPPHVMCVMERIYQLEDSFVAHWKAGKSTAEIYQAIMSEFPDAILPEIDIAARRAADQVNRIEARHHPRAA